MLEPITDLPGNVSGVTARGTVDKEDYARVMRPLIEDAKREGRHLRLLYELGSDFKRFSPAAVVQDARLGLEAPSVIERFALVSDVAPARAVASFIGGVLPCPVRVFGNQERAAAIDWLSRPAQQAGLTHHIAPGGDVIVIVVLGKLSAEDFEALEVTMEHLEGTASLRGIVVQAKSPPSWQNLGSFLRHMSFIREHHKRVRRIAFVLEGKLAFIAPTLAKQLLGIEALAFRHRDLEVAVQWARGPEGGNAEERGKDGAPPLDPVDEAGLDSFPASDPPSFTP